MFIAGEYPPLQPRGVETGFAEGQSGWDRRTDTKWDGVYMTGKEIQES